MDLYQYLKSLRLRYNRGEYDPYMAAVLQVRDAVEHGYYRTEPAEDQQSSWPWQNATCGQCPFFEHTWTGGACRIWLEPRTATSLTCRYFEHREEGQARIDKRRVLLPS